MARDEPTARSIVDGPRGSLGDRNVEEKPLRRNETPVAVD
jgi:hypothetical protein